MPSANLRISIPTILTFSSVLLSLLFSPLVWAQAMPSDAPSTVVPRLVKFSGVVNDVDGKPRSGVVGITFALYKDEQGGATLWLETQNVQVDAQGHYSVYLGASKPDGLPQDLFVLGEARWLGVQVENQAEQPRTLLLSVPYALKAGDAETIGGLPPSAFVLATQGSATASTTGSSSSFAGTSSNASAPPPNPAITGLGTVTFIPLWDTTTDVVSSIITQTGSGATAKVGVNTTTPASTLDVKGGATVRGTLSLPATGVATPTGGKGSQPSNFAASSFNSSNSTAVTETFQLKAEADGNNTSSPSGTLNLLFGSGTSAPAETGLKIASSGQITFANGQTFPGTGNGTITGVTAGAGLTGGGTSGSVSLGLLTSCASGQVLQWNGTSWACTTPKRGTITGVTAGADLTGGGTSGTVTMNLDTTKVPQLNAANTFAGNQTVNGSLSATGLVTGSAFNIGSNLFASGSYANGNAFLGFAGNTTSTGVNNTASGVSALSFNTTGSYNTASGLDALAFNTTGYNNTASGPWALYNNTTGSSNSAFGYSAGPSAGHPSLTNATAIGANAEVDASNSLVLGSINGVNGATADTKVGIGTTTPQFALDVRGTGNFTGLVTFAAGQTFPGTGTITGVTAGTDLIGGGGSGIVTLNVDTTKVVTAVVAGTDLTGGGIGGVQTLNLDTTKVPQLNAANTFTGNQTISGNLSATGLVAGSAFNIGSDPFAFGSKGLGNVFLGFAGNLTTSGGSNTASGANALASNTTGVENTAIGWEALNQNTQGSYNTASGETALASNTTGSANTSTGDRTLQANSTGLYNTADGAFALQTNTTGSYNTANGAYALQRSTGDGNTADGEGALQNNVSGNNNAASGASSLFNNTSGTGNTTSGASSLFNNTLGTGNTAGGMFALYSNSTGSYNSALGYAAGPPSGHPDLTNATAIGANAEVDASNSLVLGSINGVNGATADTNVGIGITTPSYKLHVGLGNNTLRVEGPAQGTPNPLMASFGGVGDFAVDAPFIYAGRFVVRDNGNVGIGSPQAARIFVIAPGLGHAVADGWDTYSSRRWKTHIQPLHNALATVEQLRGVSYDLKNSGKHEIGVIAEEVGKVVPEVVTFEANGTDAQGVDYGRLTALLIEAVKQQQREIRKQNDLLQTQSAAIHDLKYELRKTIQTLRKISTQGEAARPMQLAQKGVYR